MTGNRVEELEGEVQELRATVSGLTDELVETKERLRLIEDHFGPELDDIINGSVTRTEARSELSSQQQPKEQAVVDEEPEPSSDAEPAADQDDTSDGSADEAKADEEEADEESTGADDIIVA